MDGGSSVDSITQDYATAVTQPDNPTKEGYTFGGWYSDAAFTTAYSFTTMPANDITVYAKWNYAESYTITLSETGSIYTTPGRTEETPLNWETNKFIATSEYQFLKFSSPKSGSISLNIDFPSGNGAGGVNIGLYKRGRVSILEGYVLVGNLNTVYASQSLTYQMIKANEIYYIGVSSTRILSAAIKLSIKSVSYFIQGETIDTRVKTSVLFGSDFQLDVPKKQDIHL